MDMSKLTTRQRRGRLRVIVLVTILAAVISAEAGQEVGPVADSVRAERRAAALLLAREGGTLSAARGTSVIGWAWEADNSPIPYARLQLRNVTFGFVEATTTADGTGEFTFEDLEGGAYVVELVDETGRVLGVGQVFSLAPGETIAVFLKLAATQTGFGGFVGRAGQAVAATSSVGLAGLAPVGRPASREQWPHPVFSYKRSRIKQNA